MKTLLTHLPASLPVSAQPRINAQLQTANLFQIPLHLPFCIPGFDAFAFVVEFFTLAQAYLYLGVTLIINEDTKRYYGHTLFLHLGAPLGQFLFIQQQLPLAGRVMTGIARIHIFGYVQALYPQFPPIKETVTIIETHLAVPDGLDLRPGKHNTRRQAVINGILKRSGAVLYIDVVGQGGRCYLPFMNQSITSASLGFSCFLSITKSRKP